jgi:hypothetical protein
MAGMPALRDSLPDEPLPTMVCAAGPGNAFILTTFQYLNLILSSIGYTVAAGQSLR